MSQTNGKDVALASNSHGQRTDRISDVDTCDIGRTARGIRLRQVTEDDMAFLFRLFSDPARSHLWMTCRHVYDERGFHQAWTAWTADAIKAKFLVESRGRPIGLAYEYDRALEDGHTKVTTLLDEESVGRGGGAIAWTMLVDWLFRTLPLRKVYMDVYSYNTPVAHLLRKVGAVEEGVLREIRFWNGAYWDLHIFAVARSGWPDVRARVLGPRRKTPRASTFQTDTITDAAPAELNETT